MSRSPETPSPGSPDPSLQELHDLVSDLLAWVAWEGRRGMRLLPVQPVKPSAADAGPRARPAGRPPAPVSGRQTRAGGPGRSARPEAHRPGRTAATGRGDGRRRVPPATSTGPDGAGPSGGTPQGGAVPLSGAWARLARPGALMAGADAPTGPGSPGQQLDAAVARPEPASRLAGIREVMGDCRRCALCESRTGIVFGVGDPRARLVVLGEGPGEQEDRQGEPFVGAAGQMLDRMIVHVLGLQRSDVYILNMVKCRPPNNRNPRPEELDACRPFLMAQLAAIRPEFILLLGSVASRALLGPGIMRARGRWHELRWPGGRSRVMPTFHPAYLLRKPQDKRLTFEDLKALRAALDAPGAGREGDPGPGLSRP